MREDLATAARIVGWLAIVAWLVSLGLPRGAHAQATFFGLGDLPGGEFFSRVSDVSAEGLAAVGHSGSAGDPFDEFQAFRWTESGGMEGLGFLPTSLPFHLSQAQSVSADGDVVVGFSISGAGGYQAFRWTAAGGMVGLGFLAGGGSSEAHGVSANGSVVVGRATPPGSSQSVAFRWTEAGAMSSLGAITSIADDVSADGSVVVGSTKRPEAFRWTQAGGIETLGFLSRPPMCCPSESSAAAISADGSAIVGWSNTSSAYQRQAFRWTEGGGMIGLGHLPESPPITDSRALDVSGDGAFVVGTAGAFPPGGGEQFFLAFVWDATNGMRNLRDVLAQTGADVDGWVLDSANAISTDSRVIVGSGVDPDGQSQAWMAILAPPQCSDGIDNDGDGLVDYPDDPECVSALDSSEMPACSDAIDNDRDGVTDFPEDPGCTAPDDPAEEGECQDGVDNDGDGRVDYPADAQCAAASDPSERPDCSDALDNDGDGLIDLADPGCPVADAPIENPVCDDGLDNDGDGFVDFDDPQCAPNWPYWEAKPCGVGFELAAVLPLVMWLRARRRRAHV